MQVRFSVSSGAAMLRRNSDSSALEPLGSKAELSSLLPTSKATPFYYLGCQCTQGRDEATVETSVSKLTFPDSYYTGNHSIEEPYGSTELIEPQTGGGGSRSIVSG